MWHHRVTLPPVHSLPCLLTHAERTSAADRHGRLDSTPSAPRKTNILSEVSMVIRRMQRMIDYWITMFSANQHPPFPHFLCTALGANDVILCRPSRPKSPQRQRRQCRSAVSVPSIQGLHRILYLFRLGCTAPARRLANGH